MYFCPIPGLAQLIGSDNDRTETCPGFRLIKTKLFAKLSRNQITQRDIIDQSYELNVFRCLLG